MRVKDGELTDLQVKILYILNRLPTTTFVISDLLKDNYNSILSAKTSIGKSLRSLEKKGLVHNLSLEDFNIFGIIASLWQITDEGTEILHTQWGENPKASCRKIDTSRSFLSPLIS